MSFTKVATNSKPLKSTSAQIAKDRITANGSSAASGFKPTIHMLLRPIQNRSGSRARSIGIRILGK